ncbi:MAG: hypothetical protein HY269_08095 [Deltaproteobacteria bacterium]|nr:hypothetical protein [Deltaproteobacteria bacterium]
MMSRLLASLAVCIALAGPALAQGPATPPLMLESTIALPGTQGRIDHLDIDLARKRLFVAELGNGSIDVVDLASRKVIHRISGLDEPQGVAYVPKSDRLLVACGGDGTVRIFSGTDFSPRGTIDLGGDADNVRLDARNGDVVIGYGSGGLAVIDPAKAVKRADVPLPAHPEGFALDAPGGRAYVNIPDAHEIDVVDFASGKLVAAWTPPRLSSNFPIVLDDSGHVAAAFRAQAKIAFFDAASGRMLAASETCGDADDISFDAKRKRFYVSCGAGAVDVLRWTGHDFQRIGRISTSWGARTSLFVPELDRLFVAARDGLFGSDASIRVYRPSA